MNNIKLIIFDLDGTLVNAYRAITASLNYTMKQLGYPGQNPAVIRRAVGWGDRNLLAPFVKKEDLDSALLIYRSHHKYSLIQKSKLFSGSKEVLAYLNKKGYTLAVASNRPTKFSHILIRYLLLKKYFKYVLCADKLKHGKPHPEIIQKIMAKFRCRKAETVYVGDMVIDAQAGRRAGVKTIMVTTGSSHIKEIIKEKPYKVIHRLEELTKIL